MTLKQSENTTLNQLTLFSEDFPAPTSQMPGKVRASKKGRAAGYGSSSPVLLARYDHDLSSWRTLQPSLPGMEPALLATLPPWGMTRNGELFRLPPLEPPTAETDGTAWPTPQAFDAKGFQRSPEAMARSKAVAGTRNLREEIMNWPTPRAAAKRTSRRALTAKHWSAPSLEQAAELSKGILPREFKTVDELKPGALAMWSTPTTHSQHQRMTRYSQGGTPLTLQVEEWATPKAQNANQPGMHGQGSPDLQTQIVWPTLSARDWRSGKASAETMTHNSRPLNEVVAHQPEEKGQLSASWCELLQGFPLNWTELNED